MYGCLLHFNANTTEYLDKQKSFLCYADKYAHGLVFLLFLWLAAYKRLQCQGCNLTPCKYQPSTNIITVICSSSAPSQPNLIVQFLKTQPGLQPGFEIQNLFPGFLTCYFLNRQCFLKNHNCQEESAAINLKKSCLCYRYIYLMAVQTISTVKK